MNTSIKINSRRSAMLCTGVGGASILLLLVAAAANHLQLWSFSITSLIMLLAIVLSIGVLVFVVLSLFRRRNSGRKSRFIVAGIVGALPLAWVAAIVLQAGKYPMIHDITTDPANPPEFIAVAEARGAGDHNVEYDPTIAVEQQSAYPNVQPLLAYGKQREVFEMTKNLVNSYGWEVLDASAQKGRIEAVATSRLFGFRDDIVIRIKPEGDAIKVDIRSASRVGKSDLGVNAKRIRRILRDLRAAGLHRRDEQA